MIIDSPIVSGSQLASGPLTQIGNVEITGSLSVTGTINGSITGSVTSASYATSAEFLDGLDSTSFVFTSSFNTFSGSAAGRITNLEAFSSSLDATFATDASVTASILVLSQSVQASEAALSSSYTITSGSYASASGSLSIRTTNLEATSSTLVAASSSFAADSASLSTRLTGDEANITTLTSASGSFAAQSASLSTRITQDETNFTNLSSSFATTSGSISSRVTIIEGQYATTGSNVFTGPQFINQASNAISFTSTASLYTDGGLRVSKDSFVSGTAYFNNVVVYGTSSIQYITSSQVNFGTNIITVNTDTPAVRFGGLAVFDSGSTQLTGSMLWDSERNHWIYSNPSGSSYNSAMLMNGPRNTGSLGSEQGTTACALMMGQGGDHITSSMIYSYGNATCFYGQSFIDSSGAACFASDLQVGGIYRDFAGEALLQTNTSCITLIGSSAAAAGRALSFSAGNNSRLCISTTGIATFTCQVCSPIFDSNCARLIGKASASPYANSSWLQAPSASGMFIVNNTISNWIGVKADGTIDSSGVFTHAGAFCVSGNAYVSSNTTATIRLKGNSTTGTDLQNDVGGAYIWNRDATPIFFATNSTQRLNIDGNGIATFTCQICTPRLEVLRSSANNGLFVYSNSGATAIGCTMAQINGLTNDSTGNILTLASLNDGIRVVFRNDGNVGIGANTPVRKLDIVSPSEQLRIAYDTSGTVYSDFRNDSAGGLLVNTSGGYIINYIGGSAKMRINPDSICFACQVCAKALVVPTECSGVVVDVANRHGFMKYYNYGGGLVGACSGTDSNVAMWLGRFAGTIFSPTAVYQDLVVNGSGNIGIGYLLPPSRLTITPPSCTNASTIEFTNSDNAAITSYYSMTFAVNNSNTQSGRAIVFSGGGTGYGNQCSNIATFTSDDKVANFFGTICAPVAVIGSSCTPCAGINYLGQDGYRQKWLITQGRYRFCLGTPDFYGAMFLEVYATNYNQGTSELRNVKAAVNFRYAQNRNASQIYNLGGACVGAYLTNGIGIVWCNINDSVGDLIFTNAGSQQPDSVLAAELQFLGAGYNISGRFYRMCYVNTLYDTVNPYV